jgi:hypothetical protein
MPKPYPGYNPNYSYVPEVDGKKRRCMVLEILSEDKLTDMQMAIIAERLEAALIAVKKEISSVVEIECISENRFDTLLLDGLRLRHKS